MPGGYDGYRATRVRRRLRPGRISSLPVTGGLPLSISFSNAFDFDPPDLRTIDMSPRGTMASTSRAMPADRVSVVSIIVSTTNPDTTSGIPFGA